MITETDFKRIADDFNNRYGYIISITKNYLTVFPKPDSRSYGSSITIDRNAIMEPELIDKATKLLLKVKKNEKRSAVLQQERFFKMCELEGFFILKGIKADRIVKPVKTKPEVGAIYFNGYHLFKYNITDSGVYKSNGEYKDKFDIENDSKIFTDAEEFAEAVVIFLKKGY